jgi:hypothetical protein
MTVQHLQSSDTPIYQHIRGCALKNVSQLVRPLAQYEALSDLPDLQHRMEHYDSERIFPFGCSSGNGCAGVTSGFSGFSGFNRSSGGFSGIGGGRF